MSQPSSEQRGIYIGASPGELRAKANLASMWASSKNLDADDHLTEMSRYATVDMLLRHGPTAGKAEYDMSFTDQQRFAATVQASSVLALHVAPILASNALPFLLVPNSHNFGTVCVNVPVARELHATHQNPTSAPANATPLHAVSTEQALREISVRLNREFDDGWRLSGAAALAYGTHNLYYLARGNETRTVSFDLSSCIHILDFILFGSVSLMLAGMNAPYRIEQVKQIIEREKPVVVSFGTVMKFLLFAAVAIILLFKFLKSRGD